MIKNRYSQKSLKISKRYSETVNGSWIDNIIAEMIGQTLFDKTVHIKLKMEQHESN